jgi:Na+/H+ antiporter NhaD/arsenite permease-like protein
MTPPSPLPLDTSPPSSAGELWLVWLVFAVVYLGMFLGGLPRVKLDRSGVALLGGIAMLAITGMSLEDATRAVDLPTMALLLAFMVISAQLRLAGFYAAVTHRLVQLQCSESALLAALMLTAALLSAVFSNDVVCLAMTPWVSRLCLQRRMNPVPPLVGLACAANIGSAATLIGNPQNMLIGSVMALDFGRYLVSAALPVALSLLLAWGWVAWAQRRSLASAAMAIHADEAPAPALDRPQTLKGLLVAVTVMGFFLATDLPREMVALVGAGVLLLSRRLHSAEVMGSIDWPLLVLFAGLFVVNRAVQATGLTGEAVAWLAAQGISLQQPGTLLVLGALLSNLVSNVPAVMLLLPHLQGAGHDTGVLLALASTFAGNLLLVGSIANLIVADLAAREGIRLDWRHHARIGVPVTLLSLAVLWLTHLLNVGVAHR